jgi:hypothetical protein
MIAVAAAARRIAVIVLAMPRNGGPERRRHGGGAGEAGPVGEDRHVASLPSNATPSSAPGASFIHASLRARRPPPCVCNLGRGLGAEQYDVPPAKFQVSFASGAAPAPWACSLGPGPGAAQHEVPLRRVSSKHSRPTGGPPGQEPSPGPGLDQLVTRSAG